MLSPFRKLKPMEKKNAARVSMCLSAVAFLVYLSTLTGAICPGASAKWIAWACGTDVRDVVTHPLFTLLGSLVAKLPVPMTTTAFRLNLLAAIAGALVVGWIYRIVYSLVMDGMKGEATIAKAPKTAVFAGVLASAAAAFAYPFWLASTQFRPEIFDTFIIVGALHTLIVYAFSRRYWLLPFFGMLTGLGFAESAGCALAVPFLWICAVFVEWKLEWCRFRRLLVALVLFLLCSATVYLVAGMFTYKAEVYGAGGLNLLRNVVPILSEQWKELVSFFPQKLWIPVVLLGFGSALCACFAAALLLYSACTMSLLLMVLVLTVSSVVMLFDISFTPCIVMLSKGIIPAVAYAFEGIGFGMLLAAWRGAALTGAATRADFSSAAVKTARMNASDEGSDDEDNGELYDADRWQYRIPSLLGEWGAIAAIPVLVVSLAVAAVLHGVCLVKEDVRFADAAANELLDGLGEREWAVSNGLLDEHLLTLAKERKHPLHLFCAYRLNHKRYLARTLEAVKVSPLFSDSLKRKADALIATNFALFLEELADGDPNLDKTLVTIGVPDMWYSASWIPVAQGCFYSGIRDVKALDAQSLFQSHKESWERWQPFFEKEDGEKWRLSYVQRNALRQYRAMDANNFGILLDEKGLPEQAYAAYRQALAIQSGHISALLNLFELVSRGLHPEDKEWIEVELKKKVEDSSQRYPLWALSRYYGYVRNCDLFLRMGWAWAASSSPESVLAGLRNTYALETDEEKRNSLRTLMASLYAMRGQFSKSKTEYEAALRANASDETAISGLVHLALQENDLGRAEDLLRTGEKSGAVKSRLELDWAALFIASGDLSQARIRLERICDQPNASPASIAMLATVMLEQGELVPVEHKILPKLIAKVGTQNNYFVQIVHGKLLQLKKGEHSLENARACYLRALALRPDVQPLLRTVLNLDVALKDRKQTLVHAFTLRRIAPSDPYVNFLLGSIRLEEGEFGEAEDYLRVSCAAGKDSSIEALNNFAQVLLRLKRLDEAEKYARFAVAKKERYETLSTLCSVLIQRKKLKEAEDALKKAWSLETRDIRLYMPETALALARDDLSTARKALAAIGGERNSFSLAEQAEYRELEEELKRRSK